MLTDSEIGLGEQEARLLQSLKHENIVKYIESFSDDNSLILIMEYCESGLIRRRFDSGNQSKKTK